MTEERIPSVDLAMFANGNGEERQKFVHELGRAYEEIGFVSVKNHYLDEELEARLYAAVKSFFNLPEATKQRYEIEGLAGQRGYTSFGKEHAKGRKKGDLKEFWHWGQEVEGEDSVREFYPDNVLVPEIEDFDKVGLEAYRALERTGKVMLRAIALYLGLEEGYFDAKIHHGNSILRPIHYGPISQEPDDAIRAAEHEDINLITLLMGASADGLQVLNKRGEWISVTALPGQLVVNVGDMLQRLTNNKLKSTTHRVVNPPKEHWGTSRYSIPFFLHPRPEMRLDCLANCIEDGEEASYTPISAIEYLNERLAEIGLK